MDVAQHTRCVDGIEVSIEDERQYRSLTLPNGLGVIIVSDPRSSNRAAAAMSVGVGYRAAPPSIPGLAHYLEHMILLGSEKFPDEANGMWIHTYTRAVNGQRSVSIQPAHSQPIVSTWLRMRVYVLCLYIIYSTQALYKQTISKYSGRSNAATSAEDTTYRFEVDVAYLDEVLD